MLESGVLEDLAGNEFAGILETTTFNFSTATVPDTSPPTLFTTLPADDASGVSITNNIILIFSEAIQAGVGNIILSDVSRN